MGFPIRRSTDQRLFAPSRSLSQRTTSFIASYRQGIHQMPLGHLIALISNAHPVLTRRTSPWRRMKLDTRHSAWVSIVERPEFIKIHPAPKPLARPQPLHIPASHDVRCSQVAHEPASLQTGAPQAYLLFTMSRNPRRRCARKRLSSSIMDADPKAGSPEQRDPARAPPLRSASAREPKMVEPDGIEPTT